VGKKKLPYPRLELRWRDAKEPGDFGNYWECDYVLVLHKRHKGDIRCDSKRGLAGRKDVEIVMNTTKRSGSGPICRFTGNVDTPYRDGAHAKWDAAALGGLPVFATYGNHATDVSKQTPPTGATP
jgi:hypothetical protein